MGQLSELTLTLIRLAFLALLWAFVLTVVAVLRTDLYGTGSPKAPRQPARSAPSRPPRGSRQPDQPRLVVVDGPLAGTEVGIAEPVSIGRSADNTVVLVDEYVSNSHARVYVEGGKVYLEDLDSTNGTYLGRQRVEDRARLKPGDRFRVGATSLELLR